MHLESNHSYYIYHNMNKTELIKAVAAGSELTQAQAKVAIEAALTAIKEALVAGDNVALLGFGTFAVNERPEREGINPFTQQPMTFPAKKVVKFKPAAGLI